MSDKRMVVVDDRLLTKIDEHRGARSRSEYVGSCVQEVFQGTKPEAEAPVMPAPGMEMYVSRTEFEQFKQRMDHLNQEFMDFFVKYASHLASDKPSLPDAEQFARELSRLLML